MKQLKTIVVALSGSIILWIGCSSNSVEPGYQKEVVIYGYLWGDQAMTQERAISIKYTQPITESYTEQIAAIRNAHVTLIDSFAQESFTLKDTDNKPGHYFNPEVIIKPGTTYHLRVEVDDKLVTASTTVPPSITITTDLSRTKVNRDFYKDLGYRYPIHVQCECKEDQLILVDMYCEETWENAEYITAWLGHDKPEDQDEYDHGTNAEPRHITATVQYTDLYSEEYGAPTIYWYGSMIVYYGRQTMQVLAIDKNFNNYAYKEHPVYSGGVKNGIGLFASVCGEEFELEIIKE